VAAGDVDMACFPEQPVVPDAGGEGEHALADACPDPRGDVAAAPNSRITRVGRLLCLTSLDELPQFWNVLHGQMSLVGPRLLVAEEDSMVDGWARGRLDLTPGITGPSRCSAGRASPSRRWSSSTTCM
jgi:lipopolysaccharide/colanic/teichoic acid biosynthesis glycosyltransferase